jgi:hypothetical protein
MAALSPKLPQTAPLESNANYAKLEPSLVLLIVRSCSYLVHSDVHQILQTHSLPFARS